MAIDDPCRKVENPVSKLLPQPLRRQRVNDTYAYPVAIQAAKLFQALYDALISFMNAGRKFLRAGLSILTPNAGKPREHAAPVATYL